MAKPHAYAGLLATLFLLAAVLTLVAGTPTGKLPGVAMGSVLLLHIERGAAIFAGLLLVVIVLEQAWRGHLPTEISGRGLKYERFEDDTKSTLEGLTQGLAEVVQDVDALKERRAGAKGPEPEE